MGTDYLTVTEQCPSHGIRERDNSQEWSDPEGMPPILVGIRAEKAVEIALLNTRRAHLPDFRQSLPLQHRGPRIRGGV